MNFEGQLNQPESYSSEQLERWDKGAQDFKAFWENFDQGEEEYSSATFAGIQAMFLGEKPAFFYNHLPGSLWEKLNSAGFESVQGYVYDPVQVAKVIEDHPEEFTQVKEKTPVAVMQFLAQADEREYSTMRGLVLGFPYAAIKNYEKQGSFKIEKITEKLYQLLVAQPDQQAYLEKNYLTEKRFGNFELIPFFRKILKDFQTELNIQDDELEGLINELRTQIENKQFSAHGVNWIDNSSSQESADKEKRIKNAFEKSGILEVKK